MVGGEPHYFNGLAHFAPEFAARNVRLLVILLGTNDLKVRIREQAKRTRLDARMIALNCSKIALQARSIHAAMGRKPDDLQIMLVAPPTVRLGDLARLMGYDDISARVSSDFAAAYRIVCRQHGFLFAHADVDMSGSVDGIHVTQQGVRQIAKAVWRALKPALGQPLYPLVPSTWPVISEASLNCAETGALGAAAGDVNAAAPLPMSLPSALLAMPASAEGVSASLLPSVASNGSISTGAAKRSDAGGSSLSEKLTERIACASACGASIQERADRFYK